MNYTKLELAKELYEVSGWKTANFYIQIKDPDGHIELLSDYDQKPATADYKNIAPAYDLGFLVRQLPKTLKDPDFGVWYPLNMTVFGDYYRYRYGQWVTGQSGDPEDAAAKLLIKLFKIGVLTKAKEKK